MLNNRRAHLRRTNKENNGRLKLILAIIFLSAGLLVLRLFDLQILKYELYTALASDQHQVFSELKPNRGKIFYQDNKAGELQKLYAVATNKEFALVYAVPNLIQNSEDTAQKLYEIFDKASVEAEVEKVLKDDPYFKETTEPLVAEEWQAREEYKKIKREAEIESRKKTVIDAYLLKLNKKNDPYEPLKKKVDEEQLSQLMTLNLPGIKSVMQNHRYYPEKNAGSQLLGFVGFSDDQEVGQYGLEGFFDEELKGKEGSVRSERSAGGESIIVNNREYNQPKDGSDLVLTINRSIQYVVCNKLYEYAAKHGADSGSVIVMDPKTGAIIAMCSWPDYDPNNYGDVNDIMVYNNPAIFSEYEPGSIFKSITMAAGIDQGVVEPNSLYNDPGQLMIEGWHKPISNSDFSTHGAWGMVDMTKVLEQSLNTGSIYVMQKTGPKNFADYVKKFGFGEKTGLELETEAKGNIRNILREKTRPVEMATASFGQGITTTPIQNLVSYAAIANGGMLMKPYVVDEIRNSDGTIEKTQPKEIGRVISERTALLVSGMLVNVVDFGHSKRAQIDGYYIAGKTGTAQIPDKKNGGYVEGSTIHTFVGFAPADDAKFVMLTKLDAPKDAVYAESTVVPLFAEIANFILDYYKIPKQRK